MNVNSIKADINKDNCKALNLVKNFNLKCINDKNSLSTYYIKIYFTKLFILLIDMKKHDWVIKLFLNFKNIRLYITKQEVDMKHIIIIVK